LNTFENVHMKCIPAPPLFRFLNTPLFTTPTKGPHVNFWKKNPGHHCASASNCEADPCQHYTSASNCELRCGLYRFLRRHFHRFHSEFHALDVSGVDVQELFAGDCLYDDLVLDLGGVVVVVRDEVVYLDDPLAVAPKLDPLVHVFDDGRDPLAAATYLEM